MLNANKNIWYWIKMAEFKKTSPEKRRCGRDTGTFTGVYGNFSITADNKLHYAPHC